MRENVIAGALTENTIPDGGSIGDDGTLFEVQGVEVQPVGDARMPFTAVIEGLEVDASTIPVGTLTIAEGYLGDDDILYSHVIETMGGEAANHPATSINRAEGDEGDELRVRGASSSTSGTITLFDDDTDEELGTTDVFTEPDLSIGLFRFREDVDEFPSGEVPQTVRAENSNGSQATAEVEVDD